MWPMKMNQCPDVGRHPSLHVRIAVSQQLRASLELQDRRSTAVLPSAPSSFKMGALVRVAESGSFTAADNHLRLTTAQVSRLAADTMKWRRDARVATVTLVQLTEDIGPLT
jgi:hypothetical protein